MVVIRPDRLGDSREITGDLRVAEVVRQGVAVEEGKITAQGEVKPLIQVR